MVSLQVIQDAIKKIELDGTDGFHAAQKLVGWEMATAILVGYLRQQLDVAGNRSQLPADTARVGQILATVLPEKYMQFMSEGGELFYMDKAYALDNFSAFTVHYRGITWPTAEHAWQADKLFKYADPDVFVVMEPAERMIQRIQYAPSAYDAKKIAHEPDVKRVMRARDEAEKLLIMDRIIRLKFDQHHYVQQTLQRTKGRIVEDSPSDFFWGRGPDWDGRDALGDFWMKLRLEKFGY